MKLKKLNRGAIVSVLLLIGVVINIITVSAQRRNWKEEMVAQAQTYFKVVQDYVVLPEADGDPSDQALEAHSAALKEALTPIFVQNDRVMQEAMSPFDDVWQMQLDNGRRIKSCALSFAITDDNGLPILWNSTFLKESAGLSFELKVRVVFADGKTVATQTSVTMDFQRVDGQWKMTYADLGLNDLMRGRSDIGGYDVF